MQKKRVRICARATARFPEQLKTPGFPYTNNRKGERNTSFPTSAPAARPAKKPNALSPAVFRALAIPENKKLLAAHMCENGPKSAFLLRLQ